MTLQADGPDKGRAWLVAAAVFSIHLIFGGIFRSQGIFFVEFINVYNIDRRKASIPFSLYATIRHLIGFLAGIMGQKYGCRCLIIIGGILASVNTAICFFATSIEWYIVLWGVLNGLVTSITTILPHVVILQYFIKYRTTATGLGFTGGCIGSFLFPAVLELLLYSYGLNGTFLLLSSIMMHAIPAAMILRSPPWSIDKNGQVAFKNHQTLKNNISVCLQGNGKSIIKSNVCKCECESQLCHDPIHESQEAHKVLGKSECPQLTMEQSPSVSCRSSQYQIHRIDLIHSRPLSNNISSGEDKTCITSKTGQLLDVNINYLKKNKDIVCKMFWMEIPNSESCCKSISLQEHILHPDNEEIMEEIENMYSKIVTIGETSKISKSNVTLKTFMLNDSMAFSNIDDQARAQKKYHTSNEEKRLQQLGKIRSEPNITKTYLELANKDYIMSKLKQLYNCNEMEIISNLGQYDPKDVLQIIFQMRALYYTYSSVEVCNHYETIESLAPTDTKENSSNLEVVCTNVSKKTSNSFTHHIKKALCLHKKAIFILISCTRVAFFISFSPVLTFIVDFAMDKGLHEEDGKYILGALSFGDILGRMCLGWITDRGYISLPRYMFGGMMILSACIASMPLFYSRWIILCEVALFALLQGSLYVRHPGLVGKYLNADEQSIAMGCMDFFAGIITLFVPLYIGYFRDHIGSYDAIFYINGSLVMLTAIGWFFESRLVNSNSLSNKTFSNI